MVQLYYFIGGLNTISGSQFLSNLVRLPSEKGFYLNEKDMLPVGASNFLFRVDYFSS